MSKRYIYLVCTWDEIDCDNFMCSGPRSIEYAYLDKEEAKKKAKEIYSGHVFEVPLEGELSEN